MAITRTGKAIVMTAANDAIVGPFDCDSIALDGTGMTVGQRLTITDNLGNILGDHYVEGVNENAEMLVNAPKWVGGIKLVAAPAGGSWTVNVRLR